ncbi:hypothetical protein NZ698_00495 [Chryseobacterium sp. PBS4-4]|uniref:Lipoprotein n=1 Tax=Chryseobacterium edaphi TaxID=2976532 RepID=A0ABT2W166_9FLAO|nr:hypothetical protein [Chryseobacterium edaphi]MCU7615659.1 hypothetical protein [Chryseobacterium edaphi]
MKRKFFFIIFLFLFIGAVVSCTSKKPLDPVIITNTKEITKIVRDTVFKVEADSSYYEAYIKCVNGKPVLVDTPETKANSKPGKSLKQPTAKIDGDKLKVDCNKNLEELHAKWEETYIKEHEQKPIYVPQLVYKDKPLTWWQNTQQWLGRIFLGLISLGVLCFILRWKNII